MRWWPAAALVLAACGSPAPGGGAGSTGAPDETTGSAVVSTGVAEVSTSEPGSSTSSSDGGESSSSTTGTDVLSCDVFTDELDALAAALQSAADDAGIPGASLAVRFPGSEICTLEYGLADVPGEVAVAPDSLWRIGSVTKNVVAGLLMRAVDEDRVALDDPITDSILSGETGLVGVTVRDLLGHTSGVPNFTDSTSTAFWTQWETDPVQPWDPMDLVQYAWDVAGGSCFEPGMGWSYSNTNYILLGLLLEELYGEPLATLLEEQVDALELGEFFLESNPDVPPDLVRGYLFDPDQAFCMMLDASNPYVDELQLCDATESLHTSMAGAAGAVTATPAATAAWLDAFLGGEIFDEALLTEVAAFRDTFPQMGSCGPGGPNLRYGLGLFELTSTSGTILIGHNGNINGYQTMAVRSEEHDFTLVFTINRGEVDPFAVLDELLASFGA